MAGDGPLMGEIGKLGDTITQLANKVEDKTKAAGNYGSLIPHKK